MTKFSYHTVPGEPMAFVELPSLPTTPFWARRQAQAVLGGWQIPAEAMETAQLLVSELITNALRLTGQLQDGLRHPDLHSTDFIALTLRLLPDRIVIEVSDSDPEPPMLAGEDLEAEDGRGLLLVQALSKEWSYFFTPSGGKTVYCVISTAH